MEPELTMCRLASTGMRIFRFKPEFRGLCPKCLNLSLFQPVLALLNTFFRFSCASSFSYLIASSNQPWALNYPYCGTGHLGNSNPSVTSPTPWVNLHKKFISLHIVNSWIFESFLLLSLDFEEDKHPQFYIIND